VNGSTSAEHGCRFAVLFVHPGLGTTHRRLRSTVPSGQREAAAPDPARGLGLA